MNILLAALAAVLVQPLVLFLRLAPDLLASPDPISGIGFLLVAVVAVASVVVLFLGVPVFLLLRRFSRVSWTSLSTAGAILGSAPVVFFWPRQIDGYSAGANWHGKPVETYIDGVPTMYAWLSYGENILFYAIHGLVGALVFYAVLRWRDRSN